MAEKPREAPLKKGTKVEVCPYQGKVSYEYIGEHDGACGTIETIPLPDDHTMASVRLEGDLCARPFPIKALKPAKD